MNVNKYNKMCDAELEIISGGGKVGAVIGGCLGGMLMAWAAGPVSAGGLYYDMCYFGACKCLFLMFPK